MAPLGPFEPAPLLAVAVSGGADSLALALLADGWARARGGAAVGLIVDHRLRPESGEEAAVTAQRLAARGIPAEILTLHGLQPGPALAERAREARYAALTAGARRRGIVHLLLGHHAGDQAETVAMRRLSGSGADGLAGMAAVAETGDVRLLRPLLGVPPGWMRRWLREHEMEWVEDPSNRNPKALRSRLRALSADAAGDGVLIRAAGEAAAARGEARARREAAVAAELAERVAFHAEAYALLAPGPLSPAALAALLRTLGGAAHAPSPAQVAALAANPRPATLGGVRLLPAGRLGCGFLLCREEAAMAPPRAASPGAVWDGRFRLRTAACPPEGAEIGAVGVAAELRKLPMARALPAAVRRTLPAIRREGRLCAVPHLGWPDAATCAAVPLDFAPSRPAAAAPFRPAGPVLA